MFRFENFTGDAQDAAARSLKLMERLKHTQIDTEHLLLALLEQRDGMVPKILNHISVDGDALRLSLTEDLQKSPRDAPIFGGGTGQVFITRHVQNAFEVAANEAKQLRDPTVSTEHILLGILAGRNTPSARFLKDAGVTRDIVVDAIRKIREEAGAPQPDTGVFSRFTEQAKDVAQRSLEMLQRYNHTQIDVEHLMLALLDQTEGVVTQVLEMLMLDITAFKDTLDQNLKRSPRTTLKKPQIGRVYITPRVQGVFHNAQREADLLNDEKISTGHILLGVLAEGSSPSAHFLKKLGVTRDIVIETLAVIRANTFD